MNSWERRGSLVGPLILIALGVIFLLTNTGYLSGDTWLVLLRLWPLLLIAIGIDILIGRRSLVGALIALVIMILLFAGGIWLVTAQNGPGAASVQTQNISQALQGATRANVTIGPRDSGLRIGGLQGTTGQLIQGTITLAGSEKATPTLSVSGDTAVYQLEVSEGIFFGLGPTNRPWDLKLTTDVPIDLTINGGVGDNNLDLSSLNLAGLVVNNGVGSTTLTLPARGKFSARISGGLGNTTIRIPSSLAARIHLGTGLGQTAVTSSYQHMGGNDYVSANFDTASDRVDMSATTGVGNLAIVEFQTQ